MIAVSTFAGRNVALFGLGGSGLATAEALQAGGVRVIAWDDNPESVAKAEAGGIATADLRSAGWFGFAALVLSPGVPLTHPKPHWSVDLAQDAGVQIIGDVELFARERAAIAPGAPFIAITGTNGKSTTTALIAHVLESAGRDAQMGGNIGRAILTLAPPHPERVHVIECSSYQIDLAPSLNPSTGILLNLTPDHLDRHGTMEHYAEVKERLVTGARTAIVGVDDAHGLAIAKRAERAGRPVIRISTTLRLDEGLFADGSDIYLTMNGNARKAASIAGVGSLRGRHNAQNALAAMAACLSEGLEEEEIQAGFESFPGLAHRMEQVATRRGVLFVNDSKATNADAAATALSSFKRIYWIAGGLAKDGGIEGLRAYASNIAKAYLIGEAAPVFAATLGTAVDYEISGTLDAAVANAARDAEGDSEAVVLLSPACASFDQFRNFSVRGDAFKATVMALGDTEAIGGAQTW